MKRRESIKLMAGAAAVPLIPIEAESEEQKSLRHQYETFFNANTFEKVTQTLKNNQFNYFKQKYAFMMLDKEEEDRLFFHGDNLKGNHKSEVGKVIDGVDKSFTSRNFRRLYDLGIIQPMCGPVGLVYKKDEKKAIESFKHTIRKIEHPVDTTAKYIDVVKSGELTTNVVYGILNEFYGNVLKEYKINKDLIYCPYIPFVHSRSFVGLKMETVNIHVYQQLATLS